MNTRRRVGTITLSIAAGLATAGIASAHAATGISDAPAPAPNPTIVLEHGAWADASSWNGVIKKLTADGYPVVAAPDALRGVAQDAADLRGLLKTINGPIVLAGHSYGGTVITEAATGNTNIKALVYVAAFAPDAGESVGSLSAKTVAHPAPPLPIVPVQVTNPDGSTTVEAYLDRALFRQAFAADVPAATARLMAATQRPIDASALGGTVTVPAWKTIPSWYLVARNDHAISPDLERFMAERAGSHTVEINSSHAAPVSHPYAVAALIESAARTTR